MTVQEGLGKKQDPISKITKAKGAGGMAQAVECLPYKHKALSEIKRDRERERGKEEGRKKGRKEGREGERLIHPVISVYSLIYYVSNTVLCSVTKTKKKEHISGFQQVFSCKDNIIHKNEQMIYKQIVNCATQTEKPCR
jgi:hypothetical protein